MSLYDPVEIITKELQLHGVTEWRVDRHSNHPKVLFTFNGKPMMYVAPSSPSDRLGWRNALTSLRKMMGVKRLITKSKAPKRRRNRTETKISLTDLSFSVRPDPFANLSSVADRLRKQINDAWRSGESAFLSGASGASPREWPAHLSQAYVAGWWGMHALVHEIG